MDQHVQVGLVDIDMPTVYLFHDEDAICMSAYGCNDPQWEMNHVRLVEAGRNFYAPAVTNILRNVLQQAGVRVVLE